MKRRKSHIACLWALLLLLAACGEDEYHYPSVKFEFVTVQAGDDGRIQMLIPDRREPLPVSEDKTNCSITPNASARVMSNYETLVQEGKSSAVIYSLQSLITPAPKPADDPAFENGWKHDPVEVVSIWMGSGYLNIILNVKVNTGKGHVFDIIEDTAEMETTGRVKLLLYHDAGGDEPYYTRRAYLSVPLDRYKDAGSPGRSIKVGFEYYTYGKDGAVVKSEKYSDPGFWLRPW